MSSCFIIFIIIISVESKGGGGRGSRGKAKGRGGAGKMLYRSGGAKNAILFNSLIDNENDSTFSTRGGNKISYNNDTKINPDKIPSAARKAGGGRRITSTTSLPSTTVPSIQIHQDYIITFKKKKKLKKSKSIVEDDEWNDDNDSVGFFDILLFLNKIVYNFIYNSIS